MKHQPDCNWEKTTIEQCEYRDTHHYCPHPEHACSCVEELSTSDADIIKEFRDKFVEPIDSKLRAMNLNGEKYISGKAKDVEEFILEALKRKEKEVIEKCANLENPYDAESNFLYWCAVEDYKASIKNLI